LGLLLAAGCGTRGDAPSESPRATTSDTGAPRADKPVGNTAVSSATEVVEVEATSSTGRAERLLWESPTAGPTIDLAYLPERTQGIVAWRPARTLADPEAARAVESLDRWARQVVPDLEKRLGIPLREIEQLLIGFLDGELTDDGLGMPRLALVARTARPLAAAELTPRWGDPVPHELVDQTYWEGEHDAWWLPDGPQAECLVVVPREEIVSLMERGGKPPAMRRELELLLEESDADRQLTMAFAPSFFATGGKRLFTGELAPLREALDWFCMDRVLALSLSVDLAANLFLEARLYTAADLPAARLEHDLRKRIEECPAKLEQYLASGTPSDYGKEILARFPQMLRTTVGQTRTAHQDRQVILRAYLPRVAAHNLALAASLALSEIVPGDSAQESAQRPATDRTIDQKLQLRISLSSPRQTLEEAVEMFGREAGITVEIAGSDLQLDGITKNQSFAVEAQDLPAGQVLEKILLQASPDGKLVYIIKVDPETPSPRLLVTTRAAAARRGDRIPSATERTSN
jgi:hypothetical protein